MLQKSFNRINSDRSIPTYHNAAVIEGNIKFQSYQFRQINPDFVNLNGFEAKKLGSFNRINSDRSIPTATSAEPVVARLSDAEWRNLFLKD